MGVKKPPSRWQELREALGLPDIPETLLQQAFQHGSYVREHGLDPVMSNQRLEFLGDAVLDVIVADALYHEYPDLHEGVLTKAKAALVRAGSLARTAETLGLGQYLLLGKGEEDSGGRRKGSLLADVYESLVGAIYLGAGLEAARTFVLGHLSIAGAVTAQGEHRFDHKTALQELVQSHARQLPVYRTVASEGPAHDLRFRVEVSFLGTCLGAGAGPSKRAAEQEAARQALEHQDEWLPHVLKHPRANAAEPPAS
jgi:ribonuclease-3